MNRAVFLDRDGTLIEDPGYLRDPDQVMLLPGVAAALRRLETEGFRRIVVTNQSGIARGLLTVNDVDAVHHELARRLALEGASVDAWHICPHGPDEGCDCRKPGTASHRAAAAKFGLELRACWCVGDRLGDLLAATDLEARAVLVRTGDGARHAHDADLAGFPVVDNLSDAVDLIVRAPLP